jgi:hypothetical protein
MSRVRRRAQTLVEVMIALAIAAGPMLLAVHLIHSNVKGAHFNQERATARMALVDLIEILLGETNARLREISRPGSGSGKLLADLLVNRISKLPEKWGTQYRRQVSAFLGSLSCTLDEDVGGQVGLARFTLRARLTNGAVIEVRRLFRPNARPGAAA